MTAVLPAPTFHSPCQRPTTNTSGTPFANYDKEIISIFKNAEASRPLIEHIQRHIGLDTVVADLGCGLGNLLPYLKGAKRVYAVGKSANIRA